MSVFLLTYRCFSTPQVFLKSIMDRFFIRPPPDLKDEDMIIWKDRMQTPIRLRIYNVIKTWLEFFFYDGVDDVILPDLKLFVEQNQSGFIGGNGVRLLELISRKVSFFVALIFL